MKGNLYLLLRIGAAIGLAVLVALPSLVAGGSERLFPASRGGASSSSNGPLSSTVVPDSGSGVVVATIPVGVAPLGAGYDSSNGYVYVTNQDSSNVSVINQTTVVTSIPIDAGGGGPVGVAYDSQNGYIYVADELSNEVSVINGTSLLATIPVGTNPYGLVYDDGNGYIYVTNFGTNNVSVIDGTTVISSVPVGGIPIDAGYDSGNGYVYVSNSFSNTVSVINGTTVVGTIPVGSEPLHVGYDAGNGYIYISEFGSTNVVVIDGTAAIATVPVQSEPEGVGYDSGNGDVYVADRGSDNISVINGTSVVGTIPVGYEPWAVAYDSGNGDIYATNAGPGDVSAISTITGPGPDFQVAFSETGLPAGSEWWVNLTNGEWNGRRGTMISFSLPNGTYLYTVATANKTYIALGGIVTVDGGSVAESVTFSLTYAITFTQSGLPSGTGWWVNLTDGQNTKSSTRMISFSLPSGTYSYSLATTNKIYIGRGGSFDVKGANVSEAVTFSVVSYGVIFSESGLPLPGTEWWVNLTDGQSTSSSTSSISFSLSNGTYSYALATTNKTYAGNGGSFGVNGANATEAVTFSLVNYDVTFSESGLPSFGSEWWLNLTEGPTLSSTGTSLSLSDPNGTYHYTVATNIREYAPASANGSFGVMGRPVDESVTFRLVTFRVTLVETGLPHATDWWVNLSNGQTFNAATDFISFAEANGTFEYTAAAGGVEYSIARGSVTVNGAAVNGSVSFHLVRFAVTFMETGLPPGTTWEFTVNEVAEYNSTMGTLTFLASNGTYSFRIGPVVGYTVNLSSGSFTVNGTADQLSFTFAPAPGSAMRLGLPAAEGYALLGGVAAVVVIAAVTAVMLRRRRRASDSDGRPKHAPPTNRASSPSPHTVQPAGVDREKNRP